MTIELGLTPDSRWGLDAAALAAAARQAGLSAVGLGRAQADERAAESFAANGVRCHEVLALVLGGDEGANLRNAVDLAEAADVMRAEWVLTTFRTPITRDSAPTIARCAAIFCGRRCKDGRRVQPSRDGAVHSRRVSQWSRLPGWTERAS